MYWISTALIILIFFYLIARYKKSKTKQKSIDDLKSNWGKSNSDNYFNFVAIEKYFHNNNHKEEAFHIISDRSAADLDLNAIFKIIDRTSSKIGQQYLYHKLRTIQEQDKLATFNKLVLLFENDEILRLQTQIELSNLNSDDSYCLEELVHSNAIEKSKILPLLYILTALSFIFILTGIFYPVFFILLIPIFAVNMVFHYRNKWLVSNYIDGVNQLAKTLVISKKIAGFQAIKHSFPNTDFIKEIEKLKLKIAFIGFEKNINNEFATVFWLVSEIIKVLFNLEYIIFHSFIDSVTSKKRELDLLFQFIGEIDSAIATASLRASDYELCIPQFVKDKKIKTVAISHPLISSCIVNDLILNNESLLLTGSNMSGKTTFIRSVAINSILAQTVNTCFAKEYIAPYFKIYSSIRITDDLLENTSYYLDEVLTMKKLVDASMLDSPCLFVLDEIFKGTNTVERISGGKAILSFLNRANNIVLVSTHDIELTEILSEENFALYHFSEKIDTDILTFDHKLRKGKLKTRNAIKILELYDYPTDITDDAKATMIKTFQEER